MASEYRTSSIRIVLVLGLFNPELPRYAYLAEEVVDIISCTAEASCKAKTATLYRTLLNHGQWLIIQLKYAGLDSEHYPVTSARLSYDGDLRSLSILCEWALDVVSSKQFTMFAESVSQCCVQ